jgi:spore germination cell wall hydrolase CwlJ-like protein
MIKLRGAHHGIAVPQLSMQEARAFNANVPFLAAPILPARPFTFRGTSAARLQARECLATAALYEAGHEERGQRAVMQVVLNRVRARGFPKTVCGVVYQGAARATGCQFSFTCDGSLQRRRERSGWADARKRATRALSGAVFRPVGSATHYHADWIVPYWIGSLDKLAKVGSHIFYRARR